jgi:hypothetical protein
MSISNAPGRDDLPANDAQRHTRTEYLIGALWDRCIDEFDAVDRRLSRLLAQERLSQDDVFQIATESRIVEDFPPASGSIKGEVFLVPYWTPTDIRRWALECGKALPEGERNDF